MLDDLRKGLGGAYPRLPRPWRDDDPAGAVKQRLTLGRPAPSAPAGIKLHRPSGIASLHRLGPPAVQRRFVMSELVLRFEHKVERAALVVGSSARSSGAAV
jgi:hypothetical protein